MITIESFTSHDITLNNGETTHYDEAGSKIGVPLIFLHGYPEIAESWKNQIQYFSDRSKYRLVALDMRGFGLSSAPTDNRAYAMEALVTELVDFVEKLGIKTAI
ncbi:alpha beta-hydrolase [Alternaria burnsii]|uniref:Alpha beta-hydrolase n=1 Tax=Alternaria burnsii TaxID=1187904 RepID=A0A8H7EFP3_9PLEO|nr:alpha beta-hydrolase [Alternaria burnsii]KAF7676058.1 alpha beta-hydrolase [Alternaria burnsii]CAI9627787.1 unnamed protein product [Alternaria burnsii]